MEGIPSGQQRSHPWWIGPAARALSGLLRLLAATWRVRLGSGAEHLQELLESDGPEVLAFWHNRMLLCSNLIERRIIARGRPVVGLASLSRDGELAARIGRARGYRMIRGSTSRGGLAGLVAMYRAIRHDGCTVVTAPDGPRGPVYECQPGTLMLAAMARAPIVPMAFASDTFWRVRSWDGLVVPRPFSRSVVTVGKPFKVAADLDDQGREEAAKMLRQQLDILVRRAEVEVKTW